MEVAFAANQERLCPYEEKSEEDRSKFDDLRESSIIVRNLDELIDENHVIVSSSIRMKYYDTLKKFKVGSKSLNMILANKGHAFKKEGIDLGSWDDENVGTTYVEALQTIFANPNLAFKVVTVKPCLWNGMKRLCYLFARKFYPEALHNLMQLFSNDTLI
ncbi:unnamed protein product [Musa acuminata var. zebrina]